MKSTRIRIVTTVAAGALTVAGLAACGPVKTCGGSDGGSCSPTSPGANAAGRTSPSQGPASPDATPPSPVASSSSDQKSASTTTSPAPDPTSTAPQPPSSAAPTTTGAQPVLGLAGMGGLYPNARGFGTVKPSVIDNGGDPTGLVTGVAWQSWGGKTANGTGESTYVPDGGPVAAGTTKAVEIRAYDLTTCDGRPAYEHVTWWFPSEGQTYQWARKHHIENYDLCGES